MMRGHRHLVHVFAVHRHDGASAGVRNLALRLELVFGLGLGACLDRRNDLFHARFGIGQRLRFFAQETFFALVCPFRLSRLHRILQRHRIISID